MKISELLAEANMQLQVLDDTDDETTLHDPITKIKTVVPKDPTGKLTLNTKTTGPVDRGIKPGDVVKVSR